MKLTLPGDGHITAFIYILQITSNNNGPAVAATETTLVIPAPPLVIPAVVLSGNPVMCHFERT
jgi:hypothetical protein